MTSTPRRAWIDVQKKTFTAWANTVLKDKHLVLEDLDGLRDGTLLINLLEALSGKPLGQYCKAPKTRAQRIENVSIAIQYMQNQGVKLRRIGASDIVDGYTNLILDLLWKLIKHYHLLQFDALLASINKQLRSFGIEVRDFTTSWQDGRALCALVNSLEEGSISMKTLSQDPLKDTERAVNTAFELFNIPMLIHPQDIISCPDEPSIMTYLSFYPRVLLEKGKQAGPKKNLVTTKTKKERRAARKKTQAEHMREDSIQEEQAREARAQEERVREERAREERAREERAQEELVREERAREEVEQEERAQKVARNAEQPQAEKDKNSKQEEKDADQTREEQRHKLIDLSKVQIHGSCEVHTNEEAIFQIHARNTHGQLVKDCGDVFSVRVLDYSGGSISNSISNNNDGTFTVTYRPLTSGEYKIEVLFKSHHIKGSPFSITISEPATIAQTPSIQFSQDTPAEEYSTAYFGEVKLETKIDEFVKEFTQCVQHNPETTEITQAGGSMVLEDGATLQALPDTSAEGNNLSISIATPDTIIQCNSHDEIEGGEATVVYSCLPHGEEFTQPVLLKIPYDTTIPIDQLAVFHMRATSDGQPCGAWTKVEAQFTGNTAVLLTTHFSSYAVFKFTSATHQNKAKLSRATNKHDVVFPGLTYRGKCKNNKCMAYQKDVNCAKGFGTFAPGYEAAQQASCATCPLCERDFIPTKFVLHDTKVLVTYEGDFGMPKVKHDDISADKAVCYGLANTSTKALDKFKVICDPRIGSKYGIDICFVMDCTGSMGQYIEEAKLQIQGMAASLREDVRKLGLGCKVRIGFVGYRDYILTPEGTVESNEDDLLCIAELTEDLDAIVNKVGEQRAFGGDDACEHVVGGLRAAVNMDWTGSMKVIVLVADAPCHGEEFHENRVLDNFPTTGDPSGEHPKDWIYRMLMKEISFFFLKITDHTDIMIRKFRTFYDTNQKNSRGRKIEEMHMGQQATIMSTLIKSGIMKTIGNIN